MPREILWVLWWKMWYWGRVLYEYSRTPLIRINWEGELSEYAGNPDIWIFLSE
jgi:hypothetical protein